MTVQVPQDKARDVADALESDMTTALASKQDVESLGLLLRRDIDLLRADFAALRTEFAALRTEMKEFQESIRAEMKAFRDSMRAEWRRDIEEALAKQTIRLLAACGGMFAAGLGLLFAALKLTS